MRLDFILLVVDDAPDSIEQAISILGDHLESKGFSLKAQYEKEFSENRLREMAESGGRNYDLVVIDYNLGQDDINGAVIANRLRRELPYTDMIFYSSIPTTDLLGELARRSVAGVFVATRDQLDDSLTGLADTIIGKAVDLNHMRGIAMAEVAEIDVLMEETLVRAFQSTDERFVAAAKKTIKKLRRHGERVGRLLENHLQHAGYFDIVRDGRLFTHTHKYWAIRRVAKRLSQVPTEELNSLAPYETDIITNRNMLAHAKEYADENGKTYLRSIKRNEGDVIIDEEWMIDFRVKLKQHRDALARICRAIDQVSHTMIAPYNPG